MNSFLQSKSWEKFQQSLGRQTKRVAGQLLIKHPSFLGDYWYSPRPNLNTSLLKQIHNFGNDYGVMFIRVDPDSKSKFETQKLNFRSTNPTQPQDSLVLDLPSNPETLLQSFHKKTRYNLRLAERKEVTVTTSSDPNSKEMLAFIELSRGTGVRQDFRYHKSGYYRSLLESLGTDEKLEVKIFVAWHKNSHVAAIITLFDHDTKIGYYLHGASSYAHRALMGPHLVQWQAIQLATKNGMKKYDFWGIAPKNNTDEKHPWAGITRFKQGFGGEEVHFPDSFDLVINQQKYNLYKIARSIRRSLPF